MVVIGITGSIASGKSTVARLIAKRKYPLFSADKIVLKLKNKKKIKNQIKLIIKKNKEKLKILENIIHPVVRREMNVFLKKKKKFLILEIPLLIESKLNRYFYNIIFVDTEKKLRLKRYLRRNNDRKIFEALNKRQISSIIKKKSCDLIINNNYSLAILKKNVKKIIANYE
jgi:dephospho-CoA kinase